MMNIFNRTKTEKFNWDKLRNNRLWGAFLISIGAVIIIIIRLFYLQIIDGEQYRIAAKQQTTRLVELLPSRGSIYDRNMKELATSVKSNACYLFPMEVVDQSLVASKLSTILNIPLDKVMAMMGSQNTVKVKGNLSISESDQLNQENLPGVSVSTETGRYYFTGNFAPFVIGFNSYDNNGIYGVEATYNNILKGKSGLVRLAASQSGETIPQSETILSEPTEGESLVLTIDKDIQNSVNTHGEATYNQFQPNKLSVIVMDPNTGDVLAMQNFPRYDLNQPRNPRSDAEKAEFNMMSDQELTDRFYEIWRNFSVNDVYEPGSVFKLITAAASIEEDVANDNSKYYCDGYIRDIPGITIRCYRWYDPHGEENLTEAMSNSCNPAFVQMVRALGKEKFYQYVKTFGFGNVTNIDLPGEQAGIIPDGIEEMTDGIFATMSYGHGIAATPIQMIMAAAATVNGGNLLEPKIILKIVDQEMNTIKENKTVVKRQVISKETSRMMLDLLEHTVNEGTADGAKIEGYRIGGKTGTSEKFIDGAYSSTKTVASYFGVFPVDKPEYIILAVTDEAKGQTSGNEISGPLVKAIFEDIIKLKGYPSQGGVNTSSVDGLKSMDE